MSPQIRPMIRRDKPAVIRILQTTPEFKPAEVVVAEEVCDSYLDNPSTSGYYVFVAETNSSIVGYICYGPAPLTESTWDIYWMAIALEERNQGMGKALLAFAEGKIREAEGRLALIETSSQPEYEVARQFYNSKGYEVVCRIPDFYALGDDKLVFQKRLK